MSPSRCLSPFISRFGISNFEEKHLKDTSGREFHTTDLKLPVVFFNPRSTRVRLPGDAVGGDPVTWQSREDSWASFWRTKGKETLHHTGRATANGECVIVCLLLY